VRLHKHTPPWHRKLEPISKKKSRNRAKDWYYATYYIYSLVLDLLVYMRSIPLYIFDAFSLSFLTYLYINISPRDYFFFFLSFCVCTNRFAAASNHLCFSSIFHSIFHSLTLCSSQSINHFLRTRTCLRKWLPRAALSIVRWTEWY
jgi:hypothetical protein